MKQIMLKRYANLYKWWWWWWCPTSHSWFICSLTLDAWLLLSDWLYQRSAPCNWRISRWTPMLARLNSEAVSKQVHEQQTHTLTERCSVNVSRQQPRHRPTHEFRQRPQIFSKNTQGHSWEKKVACSLDVASVSGTLSMQPMWGWMYLGVSDSLCPSGAKLLLWRCRR